MAPDPETCSSGEDAEIINADVVADLDIVSIVYARPGAEFLHYFRFSIASAP